MTNIGKNFDLSGNLEETHAFIQWKGTDVCMDFHCDCGAHCHFDGYFAYAVKCPHCETIWQMPANVFPRKADEHTYPGHIEMAKPMEPDEDHSDEYVDDEGVTRLKPRPLKRPETEGQGKMSAFPIQAFDPEELPENERYHDDIDVYRARIDACLKQTWRCELSEMPAEWAAKFVREAHEDKVYASGTAFLMSQIHGRGLKGMAYTDKIRGDDDTVVLT